MAARAVQVLYPLATTRVSKCWRSRSRDPSQIQKHCLCLPFHSGKSSLAKSLRTQFKNFHVVDIDVMAIAALEPALRKSVREALAATDLITVETLMSPALDKVFAEIRTNSLRFRKTKFLFLTSHLTWAERAFKLSSIVVAAPGKHLHEGLFTARAREAAAKRAREDSSKRAREDSSKESTEDSTEATPALSEDLRVAWGRAVQSEEEINLFNDFPSLVTSLRIHMGLSLVF